jgi:hypothetical protein
MPALDGSLTPEEYAAQVAASLSAGQPAPAPPAGDFGSAPPIPPVQVDPLTNPYAQAFAQYAPGTAPPVPPVPVVAAPAEQAPSSPFPAAGMVAAMTPGAAPPPPPIPAFSFANSEAVARQGAQALGAEGAAKAELGSDQSVILKQQQTEALELQNAQLQARAQMNAEIDKQAKDIADQKIDPHRLWNSKSAGQQAASLIGIVLGGIGAGMSGGPNMALQVIDKQIERDINAQTAELGKKENLLSALFRKYGNLEQAQGMARVFKTEAYARELNAVAAQHGGEAEKAHANFLGTQLLAGIAGQKDSLANQMAMWNLQMQRMGQMGGGQQYENGHAATMPKTMDVQGFAEARNADLGRTLPPRTPGGKPVLAHNDSAALKANERLVGINGAHELLKQIEQEKGSGNILPWSNDNVKAQAKLAGLAYELARAYTGGVPNESAVKDAESQLRGPFMAYVRGDSSYQPVLDILESQKNSVYQTFAPGIGSKIQTPFKPVK